MANLAIQDTFEPYHADRDGFTKKPARKSGEKPEGSASKAAPRKKDADIDSPRDIDRKTEH